MSYEVISGEHEGWSSFFVGRGGVYKLQGSANVVRGYCRDIRFKYRANSDVVNKKPDATCLVVTTVFEGVGVFFFFC